MEEIGRHNNSFFARLQCEVLRNCLLTAVCVVVIFSTLPSIAAAQSIAWRNTLPILIESIEFNPASNGKIIYAASPDSEGVYKSYDGGYSWQHLLRGPKPLEEYSSAEFAQMFIMPSDTSVLIGGSSNPRVGVYRSTDGGYGWDKVLDGLSTSGLSIFELNNPSRIGPDTLIMGETSTSHLWRSIDKGATWDSIPSPPTIPDLCTIVNQPGSNTWFLAGSGGGAITLTTDAGASWTVTHPGDSTPDVTDVPRIAFDPQNPQHVWATLFYYPNEALIESHDAGRTWTSVLQASDEWALDLDPENPLRLWIGRFSGLHTGGDHFDQTTDGGMTWTSEPTFDTVVDIWMIKYDSSSGRLAVATSSGLFIGETRTNGVSMPQALRTQIFPNPAGEVVRIPSSANDGSRGKAFITDDLGRVIWQGNKVPGLVLSISVHQWPAGVYEFSEQTRSGISRSKFVVTH
jgi:photosystem II stability/assembly factor-like uncharacterized protein